MIHFNKLSVQTAGDSGKTFPIRKQEFNCFQMQPNAGTTSGVRRNPGNTHAAGAIELNRTRLENTARNANHNRIALMISPLLKEPASGWRKGWDLNPR
jgi:hypothetical protein